MPNSVDGGLENNEPMPSGPQMMDVPQDMGSDINTNGPGIDMGMDDGNGKSDSEIDDIFSKLDTEKQAAVIKYAKSMVEDSATQTDEEVVNEIANNILDDGNKKPEDGKDEKIRNRKISTSNPFITKSFNKK